MGPRGGTELLLANWRKYVDPSLQRKVNVLVCQTDPRALSGKVPNILWHHLDTDQELSKGLSNPEYIGALSRIVFVSNWQMQEHIREYGLPEDKCLVLRNAIEPIPWIERSRTDKIKLIYTSTPWRGLEVLLRSFQLLRTSNVELDVYSSTVIYGVNFMKNQYDWLFDMCRRTRGVNYRGYAANKAVVKAVQSANIFSYPSIFRETSCLAAIEAGAAGCRLVLTDLGALPETCSGWGSYLQYGGAGLAERFAALLDKELTSYWTNYGDLEEQSKYFNTRYSWTNRAREWNNLLDNL